MAMDKDILGQALYDDLSSFINKTIVETGDIEAARLAFCKRLAQTVIDHIKNYAKPQVPGIGLVAPGGGGAVTGTSVTGTML